MINWDRMEDGFMYFENPEDTSEFIKKLTQVTMLVDTYLPQVLGVLDQEDALYLEGVFEDLQTMSIRPCVHRWTMRQDGDKCEIVCVSRGCNKTIEIPTVGD